MAVLPRPSADTWHSVFGIVYVAMMTNVMLAVGALPLLVLLVSTDPRSSWPALALAAVLAAPACSAACAVFAAYTDRGATEVVRIFWRSWLRGLRRSLTLGGITVAALIVLVVDIAAVWGHTAGAVAIPIFAMLSLLVLATGMLALVAGSERPRARWRDVARVSVYYAVRRWYFTLLSLAALGLLSYLFIRHPAWAVGLAAAPLCYAVWANSRYSLRPVLAE